MRGKGLLTYERLGNQGQKKAHLMDGPNKCQWKNG